MKNQVVGDNIVFVDDENNLYANELNKECFNEKMIKLYRPPEGKFNEENLKWARKLGYKTASSWCWPTTNRPKRERARRPNSWSMPVFPS